MDETAQFKHYTLKHRVVAWVSRNLFDGITYTTRHGLLKGMKRRGGLGWLPEFLTRGAVTPETRFLEGLDLGGLTVYDIGAFQGMMSLFFARRAARVISYEPSTENRERLVTNVALNRLTNVTVCASALGASVDSGVLNFDPLMPGGSTVRVGESQQERAGLKAVRITTLDIEIASGLPKPDFIKIDVEGMELAVLQGARDTLAEHRPALMLEVHGETIAEKKRNVATLVSFLTSAGYRDLRHVESGKQVAPGDTDIAMQGHLYCPAAGAGERTTAADKRG
jgi:FkbM family methyltransferase